MRWHDRTAHLLFDAAQDGSAADVAELLADGADVSATVANGKTALWFKRLPSDFPIPFEVWEVFVMPHMVTRDYQPPPPPAPAPPRRSARVAGRGA